jgi:predicted ATPase
MKLESLKYKDSDQEWEFDKIDFFKLTLLVGISGVGKTQILDAINSVKRIALGRSTNGVQWDIEFSTNSGGKYHWFGEFEKLESANKVLPEFFDKDSDKEKPKIVRETISLNGNIIIERDVSKFIFSDKEMPKLNSTESAIYILKEEDLIKEAYESFKLIVFRDHTQKEGIRYGNLSIEKLKKKYTTFEQIKESDLDTLHKLALVYDVNKKVFNDIKERFIEIFPQVEDIKMEPIRDNEFSNFIFEATVIQIKEKNVNKWIPHNRVSSGMLRTLLHISEMFLWNEGTVILIDEFENSLGINCIDVLTEDIIYENDNIQFIATSHHPYIINKIPYSYWKIVFREGSIIKTKNAIDFDMGKSHHDNFMSLINNPLYKDGKR